MGDAMRYQIQTCMIYLDGSKTAFRCDDCNSNCFHLTEDDGERIRFACNLCIAEYEAKRDHDKQTVLDNEITDGVSSPAWFENIKPIEI